MKKLSLSLVLLSALTAFADPVKIGSVRVEAHDGFGGDVSSVSSRCCAKAGDEYDPAVIMRDVANLKASGQFEDIAADTTEGEGGVEVVFKIKRKVRYVKPLIVEGCEFFSESKIVSEAGLKDGFLYGEADLAEAAKKVLLAYLKKNFADAQVTTKAVVKQGNDAEITFVINEGTRHKIRRVVFEGADHAVESSAFNRNANPFYSLEEESFEAFELHEAINDYPWWNPIGWFTDEPVTEDQRAQCCDKIVAVYRNHGYLDARVTGPELVETNEDDKVDLVFTVVEGPCYRLGAMSVKGLTKYSVEEVVSDSKLPDAGVIAEQQLIDEAAHRIKLAVGSGELGLAETTVDVRYLPEASDSKTLDLDFDVHEGVPVIVNEVKIRGNDFTKDKVIRREIMLGPGGRMHEKAADQSQRKLENLDYFARVRYYLESANLPPDAEGREFRNLVYEVEEKNTGSFMVGVGASSVDSVYVQVEVNQSNFDLFAPRKFFRGAGQKGRAYVAYGPRYQSAEVSVTEPWFLDRQLELTVEAYRRLRWYDQYDLIRTGAGASVAYPVKFWPTQQEAFGRIGFGFSGEYIEFDDVDSGLFMKNGGALVSYKEEERKYGDAFEPVFHVFWNKADLDRPRMPSKGYRARIFGDVAPFGDNTYWRVGANYRHYWEVWERYHHTFMTAFRFETIDKFSDDVPIYNRMFLGGPRSIRGIRYRHVAPMVREVSTRDSWSPWGGQTLACANFEYTIPIVKMFRFAVFSDVGGVAEDVFDLDMGDTYAWTVGVGFRLDLPMFPIRLDFGFPIVKPDEADKETFSFTIGYDF